MHLITGRVRSGFTLVELLVVIAIIALLAAILFPVFARSRENARRAACQSNLKQIGMALMQYAQDYDERMPALDNFDNDGGLGAGQHFWMETLQPYVKSTQVFQCPSLKVGANPTSVTSPYGSYGLNVAVDTPYRMTRAYYGGTLGLVEGKKLSAFNNVAELGVVFEDNFDSGPYCQGFSNGSFPQAGNGWFSVWYDSTPTNPAPAEQSCCGDRATPDGRHFAGLNVAFADGHVKWKQYKDVVTVPSPGTNAAVAAWHLWTPEAP